MFMFNYLPENRNNVINNKTLQYIKSLMNVNILK